MSLGDDQRKFVRTRAGECCEYCRLPASGGTISFHVDHIRPLKHRGTSTLDNLCYACYHCNAYKGSNISGYDPLTDKLTRLYHPRQDVWNEHFTLEENSIIRGISPVGRTTADVLNFNEARRVQRRKSLGELGEYPCQGEIALP